LLLVAGGFAHEKNLAMGTHLEPHDLVRFVLRLSLPVTHSVGTQGLIRDGFLTRAGVNHCLQISVVFSETEYMILPVFSLFSQ
jgi:hypothetical protein